MDYLQYSTWLNLATHLILVLNLVINGLPSIPFFNKIGGQAASCFKPCYKWITFNTKGKQVQEKMDDVLNLVINGLPSIRKNSP